MTQRPFYEARITLGNIIQLGTVLLTLAGLWYGLSGKVERLEQASMFRDAAVTKELANQAGQLEIVLRQSEELRRSEQRLRERLIHADIIQPE